MSSAKAAPFSVLRHPPFLFFWAARSFGAVAWQMQAVAVGWQMYELTGRAFDLGLVGLMEFFPIVAFMLAVGPLADRFDRRRIVQASQALEALAAAALALATATGVVSEGFILAAVFVLGSGRAFEAPTMNTILPAIVPSEVLPRAVATNSSATQMATIAGPGLGGILYAVGPTLVYAVCAGAFLVSVILLQLLRLEPKAFARIPLTLGTLFAGVHYIRRNPIILGIISLDLFAVLLGGAVALLPIYASDIFHVGSWGLGLLRAAPAVGALAAITFVSRRSITWPIGRVLFGAVAMFGLATIVFAVSTSFPLSLLALVVLGASDCAAVVIRSTLVQLETVDEMRGRVSAVNSMFIGTSNALGAFESGITAAWFGVVPAVLIGGVGTLAVVALWLKLFPGLYGLRTFPPQRVTAETTDIAAREAAVAG